MGFLVDISVKVETAEALRYLKRVGERNLPLAVAQSLTASAKHLQKVQTRSLPRYFDRPTPFTRKAFGISIAKARDFKLGRLKASVFAKPAQAKYLEFGVYGGTRRPNRRAVIVPGSQARLNRYGNLTRRFVAQQLSKPNVFSGTINGLAGVWERRRDGTLRLLVHYQPSTEYDRRYPYHQISERVVPREVSKQLNRAIQRAVKAASYSRR